MRNEHTITIIPAAPGWRVCEPVRSDNGERVEGTVETDIIAWAVIAWPDDIFKFNADAEPVTAGDGIIRTNHALRTPEGRVFRKADGINDCPDMDAFIAEENRKLEQENTAARRTAEKAGRKADSG